MIVLNFTAVLFLTFSGTSIYLPRVPWLAAAFSPAPESNDIQQRADEVDDGLTKISSYFKDLLEDPWLRIGVHYLSEAQSAAKKLVLDGKPVLSEVNRFHNNLDEFLRGLDQLEKGYRPRPDQATELHGAAPPTPKLIKTVREGLVALKNVANEQEGLREIGRVKLKDSTSAADAVEYASLVLDKVQILLYSRGMGQITSEEKKETDEKMAPSLDALRASIHGMVDSKGARVVQLDEKGERRSDQLVPVKKALSEAVKSADAFKDAFAPARERTKLVQADLSMLRENVLKPRALRD